MRAGTTFAAACILGVVASMSAGAALAADLVILTNQGATPGVKELADAFSRASGHHVTVVQPAGAELQRRLDSGPADLMTGNPEPMQELAKKGKIIGGSVAPFVLASLGVSVRAGLPKPDISTVEAYKAALLAAKSIGYSYGCSGTNVEREIAELGLTEVLKAKTVRTGTGGGGGPVTDYLARGDFDLGIQQTNIMFGVPGTDYVGVPPGSLDKKCQSDVAVTTVSKEPDVAREMIKFMVSPAAAPLLRKTHAEPYKS